MQLILESNQLSDYLTEVQPAIVFSTPYIQNRIKEIEAKAETDFDKAKMAFEIARDEVLHNFDTKDPIVTISAEEALQNKAGICFAKAHTFATLTRGMGIPTGFCYQRVLRKPMDTSSGYALHGLNAVYLKEKGWFRVDSRGNKPGIDSQFNAEQEQLAYVIHEDLGEIDYPNVFIKPLDSVIESMKDSATSQELFFNRPESI